MTEIKKNQGEQDFEALCQGVFNAVGAHMFNVGKTIKKSSDKVSRGFLGDCYSVSTQLMTVTLLDSADTISASDAQSAVVAKLREVFLDLLTKCEENEYDLSPYYEDDELFGENEDTKVFRLPTRAFAAALNMFCLALRDNLKKRILALDDSMIKRITAEIARILKYLSQAVIREGNKDDGIRLGWTCYFNIKDDKAYCNAPLYTFADTYLVIEALTRFSDIYKDEKEKAKIYYLFADQSHREIVADAMRCMREVAVNFYQRFSKNYGEEFFSLDANGDPKPQTEIASGSPVLFYPLYIALIAMNGFADITLAYEEIRKNAELFEKFKEICGEPDMKLERIDNFIEFKKLFDGIKNLKKAEGFVGKLKNLQQFLIKTKDAMDMVVKKSRDLKDRQVDTELMDFLSKQGESAELFKRINKRRLESAYINPLILSAKSLIIMALTKYPESDMGERFFQLMDWRAKKQGEQLYIWSEDRASAYSTERSVSAILYDYAYYYDKYERLYSMSQEKISEKDTELQDIKKQHIDELNKKKSQLDSLNKRISDLTQENNKLEKTVKDSGALIEAVESIVERKFFKLIGAVLDAYSLSNVVADDSMFNKTPVSGLLNGNELLSKYDVLLNKPVERLKQHDPEKLYDIYNEIPVLTDKLNTAAVTTLWRVMIAGSDENDNGITRRGDEKWQKAFFRFINEDFADFLFNGVRPVYATKEGAAFDSLGNIFKHEVLNKAFYERLKELVKNT